MAEIYAGLPDGTRMIDRLRVVSVPQNDYRVSFDWDDDPDEPWILNVDEMPIARRT